MRLQTIGADEDHRNEYHATELQQQSLTQPFTLLHDIHLASRTYTQYVPESAFGRAPRCSSSPTMRTSPDMV